jgi:myo-inositol 2-dehydrogenase/D-chiro-inositol 1-dehydrogenase
MNIAILGCGRIGQVHADSVAALPNITLAAVADPFPANAELVSKKHDARIADIDEILADASIDAVIICTPTDTHADLIEQASAAGKAIFCEKPIDLDVPRIEQCLATVEKDNTTLMVGFNRRFDPNFSTAKQAIVSGQIGQLESIHITSRDPGLPPYEYIAKSGGIFRDMTIHDFDMARFLLGEEPVSVYATASRMVDPKLVDYNDYDTASVIMTTASGVQCSISNSRRASYGYDQRVEVCGSLGKLDVNNIHNNTITMADKSGFSKAPLLDFFMERYTIAYQQEMLAFAECITNKTPANPSGQDGLLSVKLADAAVKSVKTGNVVRL